MKSIQLLSSTIIVYPCLHEFFPSSIVKCYLRLSPWFTNLSLNNFLPSNQPFPMEFFLSLPDQNFICALNKGSLESISLFLPVTSWCQYFSIILYFLPHACFQGSLNHLNLMDLPLSTPTP